MISLQSRDLKHSLADREKYLFQLENSALPGVLLHTCNRVEVYSGMGEVPEELARHLFRVVCGLESALPGETAIQGQVKDAYESARGNSSLAPQLHKLFQQALRVGKRVRTETALSKGALSHSKAVLEILKQDHIDLKVSKILIIGVNNLNESVIKYLAVCGRKAVFIANRTYQKALELSVKYNCEAVRFEKLQENLRQCDILISSTAAPHYIIRKEDHLFLKPVTIFDLAVPRDIDPRLGLCPGVTLYNVEDIETRINSNKDKRIKEIEKADKIIEVELKRFYAKS